MLAIQLFGPPQVLLDDQPVNIERRKSRAMLYYIAANEEPVQRERLLGFFWPDLDRVSAQQSLRTTLHSLRKALGDGLVVDRDEVSLDANAQIDARMFFKNLAIIPTDIPKLVSILDLYHGPFLQDFSLPDSPEFETWQEAERERAHRLAMRALSALSRSYESNGDLASALVTLDRALLTDPLQEDIQREAIRLAYLSGDRPDAIRRYDALRRLLDDELGMPPMTETRALYDDIINDRLKPVVVARAPVVERAARAAVAGLPFVSRESELRILGETCFAGRLALIEGEPGIGKTRLAEHFLRQSGALTLTGAARELEQSMPYQPVIEALSGLQALQDWPALLSTAQTQLPPVWLEETARLAPFISAKVAGKVSAADEWRLWEGLAQFLSILSREKRILFFLDDLHWADPSTLGLLGYLIRHASGQNLGFLAATRPYLSRSALANLVSTLIRENRLVQLSLSRFTEQDVREMTRMLAGDHSEVLAEWLLRYSEGNPYILAEMVRNARQHGILTDHSVDTAALAQLPVVPQTVYSLIQSRLARLSDPARRVLDVGVALGRDFDFPIVSRASALSEEAALDGLDELLESGLVEAIDGERYRFNHSLTMEVAYREMGEARNRLVHRRIAEALESLYRRTRPFNAPALLAFHFSEGNDPQRAAPYAFQAGEAAAKLAAWKEAIAYFEQALAGTEGWPRYPILIALGKALQRAGESARAAETFRSALELARAQRRPAGVDEARLLLAASLLPQSRYAEAIKIVREVIETGLPENVPQAELWWGAALSLEGADLEGAAEHLNRAAEGARKQDRPELLAEVEFELGSVAAQRGNLPRAIEHYRLALVYSQQVDSPETYDRRALAYNNLGYHLLLMGDPTAEEYARKGMEFAKEKGLVWVQSYLHSTLGEIALARKDLDAAEHEFTAGLELSRQIALPERVAGLMANLGLVARERGQITMAILRLSTALAQAEDLGQRHLAAQIRVWLAPLLPKAEARAMLAEARAIASSGGRKRLLEEIEQAEEAIKNP